MNQLDVFGLETYFTFTDGSTQTAHCTADFINKAGKAAKGSIVNIKFSSHTRDGDGGRKGPADVQDVGNSEDSGAVLKNHSGIVVLQDEKNGNETSLASLLEGKFSPKGTVTLDSCRSGKPGVQTNIAKEISEALRGISVTGQNQDRHHILGTDFTYKLWGDTTTTYINGKAK